MSSEELNAELLPESNSGRVDDDYTADYMQGESLEAESKLPCKCSICGNTFNDAVILSCLHVFDRECLKQYEKIQHNFPSTECPKCKAISDVVINLVPYNAALFEEDAIATSNGNGTSDSASNVAKCSLCTDNGDAVSKCIECAGTLCAICLDVHKRMKMFSGHNVIDLTEEEKKHPKELAHKMSHAKPVPCGSHRDHCYKLFCFQCNIPLCEECLRLEHSNHVIVPLEHATERVSNFVQSLLADCLANRTKLADTNEKLDAMIGELQQSREQNKGHIEEVCNDWKAAIDDVKEEFLKRNRDLHNELEFAVLQNIQAAQNQVDHMDYAQLFALSYLPRLSPVEYAKVCKSVLMCLESLAKFHLPMKSLSTGIPFMDHRANIRDVLRTHFGWFEQKNPYGSSSSVENSAPHACANENVLGTGGMAPVMLNDVGRLTSGIEALDILAPVSSVTSGMTSVIGMGGRNALADPNANNFMHSSNGVRGLRRQETPPSDFTATVLGSTTNVHTNGISTPVTDLAHPILGLDFTAVSTLAGGIGGLGGMHMSLSSAVAGGDCATFSTSSQLGNAIRPTMNPAASGDMFMNSILTDMPGSGNSLFGGLSHHMPSQTGLGTQSLNKGSALTTFAGYNPNPNPPFPNRQGRCQAMNVRTRWGSLGPGPDQMNSPHGFCLGFEEDVVVADTQNHRILVFSKEGFPRAHFGIAGREEGQLWYPRKVTVLRSSQKYVVCDRGSERSRMQVFTRSGHFLKKINIRYIDIVAGLAINSSNHIVAVDSVSPSVFIISESGDLVHWFDCSEYMREPSDIAINQNEYFICDFKGHCVAVFNESGGFLRRIGSDAITNFPNGIDVSDYGDVLIGDSHGNRFHVAVFDRSGEQRGEFECPNLKVSRCCGLKITTEGFLVTLAKNNNQVFIIDTLYVN